jgi:hypothetical protein
MSRKSLKIRKSGSTTTKHISAMPPSSSMSRHPSDGLQPHGFRKKGSQFKVGNSHSTITANEQAEAYRGIDAPEKEEQ